MKHTFAFALALALAFGQTLSSQTVNIQIDASKGRKAISPYIYGKNNNVSDAPGSPTTGAQWKLMREAGLRYTRENGGNNATKYNWRLKLSSHPDWYNNVYNHDWDYAAKTLGDSLPGVQGMWAFQLIGQAASNLNHNFNDWAYNNSTGWGGTCQNLAGGGVVNSSGGCFATTNGDTSLYLEKWTPDSTTGILDHWFGTGGLGYNKNNIRYWSMDNEPDIWGDVGSSAGTHDDAMPTQPAAEAFMQRYFAVAKKARAKYPTIKLTGPVPASEWQWYSWANNKITVAGQSYVWLEFFIKRCAEEQTATGIRLLDVIDIHSYPGESNDSDIVQGHRIYFDTLYNYPGANGVKTTSPSGWDNTITKEYVFGRVNKWLTQYMGANHGVTCAVSEFGLTNNSANVTANSYASILGTFADNSVEFFTPWYWYPGMWETLHLYSHYAKSTRVQSVSSNEHDVSAYSSVNAAGDSMTVVLVNRALTATHATNLNLLNFTVANGTYTTKQISSLPSTETFVSNASNALHSGTATANSNSISISLPALSTTAIILKGTTVTGITEVADSKLNASLFPNPVSGETVFIDLATENVSDLKVELFNVLGEITYSKIYSGKTASRIQVPCGNLSSGVYVIHLSTLEGKTWNSRFIKR
jgi:hypothetical protein